MRTFFIASLAALAFTRAVAAPQSPPQPPVDPSRISFEHDGIRVKGFALYVTDEHGRSIRIDLGMPRKDKSGKMVVPLPPLPAGTYSLDVVAYNRAGESPRVHAQPPSITLTVARTSDTSAWQQQTPPATRPNDPQPEAKAKRGILSRVYRGIVGSDDGAPAEK